MLSVRPKISELVFQLYGRALHPELFEVYNTQQVSRGNYTAEISITSTGHIVTWRHDGLTLTEVATAAHHPLPQHRRLLARKLKGSHHDYVECRGGAHYEAQFSLELETLETFWTFQTELTLDGARKGMLHKFDSSGRMALGAMSYIHSESRDRSLLIQAFHTFPDDYAIVKSQSLFNLS